MRRAGIGRDTLRYYERRGVLPKPPRSANGYRDYPESTLAEIRFIRLAQSIGLPLEVIRRGVPYASRPVPGCPELRRMLQAQLEHVESELVRLRTAKTRLRKWLRRNAAEAASRSRVEA